MIEGLKIPIPKRLQLIRITVCISLIISVCLSYHLWGGERLFPYSSIYSFSFIKPPFDYLIVILFVSLLIASLCLEKQRLFIFFSLLVGIILVLFDLNRLQPWFYLYFMFLFVLLFYNGRIDDANKFTSFFIVLQVIFCSIYIFNGINQLNSYFNDTELPELISPLKNWMSNRQFLFVRKVGMFIPYSLLFIGIGLLIRSIRYLAISFAVILHVLLIIFLFPSQTNQNYAIWFCNISFIPLLLLLFSGKTKQRYYSPTLLLKFPLFYLSLILFWIMPCFNFTNNWPNNLSANFKSNSKNAVEITFSKAILNKLPNYVKHFCYQKQDVYVLDYANWCKHELKTNCYQEPITFNNIYNYLLKQSQASVNDLQMRIKPEQNLLFKR